MTWKMLLSSSTNEKKKKKKKKKVERSSSVFQCGVDVWLDGGQVMQARCHCFYYGLVHGVFFSSSFNFGLPLSLSPFQI